MLGAARDLHLLELVTETLRATLDTLAAVFPDWLRGVAQPAWYERYAHRAENFRLPRSDAGRASVALTIGADGYALLDALDTKGAPAAARASPAVTTLRTVWSTHYARRDDGTPPWREAKEWLPVGERVQSPHDPDMHYSTKRGMEWSGYKVHVTEACDDDTARIITPVRTGPAMLPNMASTAANCGASCCPICARPSQCEAASRRVPNGAASSAT